MTLSVTGATAALAAIPSLSTAGSSGAAAADARHAPSSASPPPAAGLSRTQPAQTSLFATVDGLGQALSAADAAEAAGGTVLGLLQQMRAAADQAGRTDIDDTARTAHRQAFSAAAGQVVPTLASATVNGTNLLDGSQTSALKAPLGDGSTASLTPLDLTLGGPTVGVSADASLSTAEDATGVSDALGQAIGAAGQALSTLQTQADQLRAHGGALQALGNALASPADDSDDGIRLLALQVGQRLSTSPSAIANAAPQSILSLFRS